MDDKRQLIASQIAALRERFLGGLPDRLGEIEKAAARALDDGADEAASRAAGRDLYMLAHKLCGAAGTFQADELAALASELERAATPLADRAANADERQLVADLVQAMMACTGKPGAAMAATGPTEGAPASARRKTVAVAALAPGADTLSAAIREAGYDTYAVAPDAELWQRLAERGADAVITDGAEGLPARPASTVAEVDFSWTPPVVAVGDGLDFAARLRAVRLGADEFVPLPVDAATLAEAIERVTANDTGEPFRVLIVAGDRVLAAHLKLVLNEAGVIAEYLTEAERLPDTLERFAPEVLLADGALAACSGTEIAAVARQDARFATLPIVFLSAGDAGHVPSPVFDGGGEALPRQIAPRRVAAIARSRAARHRRLRAIVAEDGLTGLLNPAASRGQLAAEVQRARRSGQSLVLALLNIDGFRTVNQRRGHAAGDSMLRAMADLLRQRMRATDVVGRTAGDEFAVVLSGADLAFCRQLFDGLRADFAALAGMESAGTPETTVSCGLAAFPDFATPEALLDAASQALLAAKRGGKNRVETAQAERRGEA